MTEHVAHRSSLAECAFRDVDCFSLLHRHGSSSFTFSDSCVFCFVAKREVKCRRSDAVNTVLYVCKKKKGKHDGDFILMRDNLKIPRNRAGIHFWALTAPKIMFVVLDPSCHKKWRWTFFLGTSYKSKIDRSVMRWNKKKSRCGIRPVSFVSMYISRK